MKRKSGILALNRFELMRRATRAGILSARTPAVPLRAEEVFLQYRGFDGEAWPQMGVRPFSLEDGLADLTAWPLVADYIQTSSCFAECDVIALAQSGEDPDQIGHSGWRFAGFEVGAYESEWSHFSIILNEVLFGIYPELRSFSNRLNHYLLMKSLEDSWALLRERNRLIESGRDLEEGQQYEPIAIFLRMEEFSRPN